MLKSWKNLNYVDYLFVPVGGGGLCAGVGSYFKTYSPKTKIIGVEPEGAPAMYEALKTGHLLHWTTLIVLLMALL